jgi:hypothetical protein
MLEIRTTFGCYHKALWKSPVYIGSTCFIASQVTIPELVISLFQYFESPRVRSKFTGQSGSFLVSWRLKKFWNKSLTRFRNYHSAWPEPWNKCTHKFLFLALSNYTINLVTDLNCYNSNNKQSIPLLAKMSKEHVSNKYKPIIGIYSNNFYILQ